MLSMMIEEQKVLIFGVYKSTTRVVCAVWCFVMYGDVVGRFPVSLVRCMYICEGDWSLT